MAEKDDVRRICLSLPETEEGPSYGTPGFRVKGKLFARLREDPDALVIRLGDLSEKEALMRSEPEKYFETPHYSGHPSLLVRLEAVDVDELKALLIEAWLVRAPKRLAADYLRDSS